MRIRPKLDQRKCQNLADVEYVSRGLLWSRHHGGFLTAILRYLDTFSLDPANAHVTTRLTLAAGACCRPVKMAIESLQQRNKVYYDGIRPARG